jgi:hypothetical protein
VPGVASLSKWRLQPRAAVNSQNTSGIEPEIRCADLFVKEVDKGIISRGVMLPRSGFGVLNQRIVLCSSLKYWATRERATAHFGTYFRHSELGIGNGEVAAQVRIIKRILAVRLDV